MPPASYDGICVLAKLFECEIQVLKKIQRQLLKYSQTQSKKDKSPLDLQITQLYQALDLKGSGRLTRKQLKGIMHSMEHDTLIQESDLSAVMRRVDTDTDDEISFSDFFSSLLPYFIFGEMKHEPKPDDPIRQKKQQNQNLLNLHIPKPFSKSKSANRQPITPLKLQDNNLDVVTCIRSPLNKSPLAQKSDVTPRHRHAPYSENQPELYYHRSPNAGQPPKLKENERNMKREIFSKPLVTFFQNCIDFERKNEINK